MKHHTPRQLKLQDIANYLLDLNVRKCELRGSFWQDAETIAELALLDLYSAEAHAELFSLNGKVYA